MGVNRASLRQLRNSLMVLRDFDLTVVQVLALIEIALSEEATITTIADTLEIQPSTATRAADILSERGGRGNRTGLRWVRREPTPGDYRTNRLRLTARGERVLMRMSKGSPDAAP